MKKIPTINYDVVQPDFMSSEEIKLTLNSSDANMKNFQELYRSYGIIDFSNKKKNVAHNLASINLGMNFASKFVDIMYSKGKFELGLITFIIDDPVSLVDLSGLINQKAQETLDIEGNPRVMEPSIEHNIYLHVKFLHKISKYVGRNFLSLNLTSYGIGIIKKLANNKTKIDFSIIIRHERDFTIFRAAMSDILFREFGTGLSIHPLNIPITKEQINIIKEAYKKLLKLEFNFHGLTDCEALRGGDRDDTKDFFLRCGALKGRGFDFETIKDFFDAITKENQLVKSMFFGFTDDLNPNYFIICSYHFKQNKTTVKFINTKYSEEDFDEVLINEETKSRSIKLLNKLDDYDLEYTDKFYILHRFITALKTSYDESLKK